MLGARWRSFAALAARTLGTPRQPLIMAPRRGTKAKVRNPGTGHEVGVQATGAVPPSSPEAAPAKAKKPRKAREPSPPPGPFYDTAMRAPKLPASEPTTTVLCWNVAGLRGLLKKSPQAISDLIAREQPDVLCLQEIKLQDTHCDEELHELLGLGSDWSYAWNCSQEKKGYAGTAILSRIKPQTTSHGIGRIEHDGEGRVVCAEFPGFYLVTVYVPNSGDGLKRLEYRVNEWDEGELMRRVLLAASFSTYVKDLERTKPVVVCGDLNCARQAMDIHAPKTNTRSAGFTPEERESFQARYMDHGFVDAFRQRFPEHVGYTYWSYRFNLRARNKGWRLDYFLVSHDLWPSVYDVFHLQDVMGSDHCPIGLTLRL